MSAKKQTFEQEIARLEEIVAALEKGDAPLADYLEKIPGEDRREVRLQTAGKFNAYYHDNEQALREAMDALAGRFSPEELDAAEQKVVKLMKGPDGAPVELPFGEEEQG